MKQEKIKMKKGFVILDNLESLKNYNGNDKIIYSGNLILTNYPHKLPNSFTHCGGYLYLRDYKHKLPNSFTHCGGYLDLTNYKHKLPYKMVTRKELKEKTKQEEDSYENKKWAIQINAVYGNKIALVTFAT